MANIPITPEDRLKKRLRTVTIICAAAVASVLLFVVLYIRERAVTQQNYQTVFSASVREARQSMLDLAADSFDGQTKYLSAASHLSTAREMLFLLNTEEKRQTCFNELYYAYLKYPEQMAALSAESAAALELVADSSKAEDGYAAVRTVLDKLDKLGK